jgi:hypothetical protein
MIDTVDVLDETPCMESDLDVADLNRKLSQKTIGGCGSEEIPSHLNLNDSEKLTDL